MDTHKTIGTILASAFIATVSAVFLVSGNQGPPGPPGQPGHDGKNAEQTLGAVSSPDMPFPYISWGGVRRWQGGADLIQGNKIVCAVQSPPATTTIEHAAVRFDFTGQAIQTVWELGRGTTAGATTTSLAKLTLASGAQGTIVATTSVTALTDGVVAPSSWISTLLSTSSVGSTFLPTGHCSVSFVEI